MELIFKQ